MDMLGRVIRQIRTFVPADSFWSVAVKLSCDDFLIVALSARSGSRRGVVI